MIALCVNIIFHLPCFHAKINIKISEWTDLVVTKSLQLRVFVYTKHIQVGVKGKQQEQPAAITP